MILKSIDTMEERLDCFARFVIERERIRKLKEKGAPRPWTKDPILGQYHFCNVRRADDRVTKFIGKWVQKTYVPRIQWFGYAVARWFNEPDVLDGMPATRTGSGWNPYDVKKYLAKRREASAQIFRGSYIITGAFANKGQPKYEAVVDHVLTPLYQRPPLVVRDSIHGSWLNLMDYTGFGSFMAGQVVADWQTFGVIKGKDVNTWAPLGPGSARGLYWTYEPSRKLGQEDAVKLMRHAREHLMKKDRDLARSLTLHDVQNCFCEFSKYVRGYSKTKYVPFEPRLL